MGMAASQARLLSITSRMSDNELRSQLINNQKIRLATESSKASERYVAALNNTKMMYSAYDVAGNPLNKELTFSNLTAYSSYNNQYGLKNLSGQSIVSEETATNYEAAVKAAEGNNKTTALEEFLKSYNLEKGTTFFDELTTDIIDACLGMPEGETSGLTGADLKAMYLGGQDTKSVEHEGYDNIKSGTEYNSKFEPKFTRYNQALDKYMQEMSDYCTQYNVDILKLVELKNQVAGASGKGTLEGYYNKLVNAVNQGGTMGIQGDTYFRDYAEYVNMAKNLMVPQETTTNGNEITVGDLFKFNKITHTITKIGDDNCTFTFGGENADHYIVNQNFEEDGDTHTIPYYIPKDGSPAYFVDDYYEDSYKSTLINLIDAYLKESIYHYDYSKFNLPSGSDAEAARNEFYAAASDLSKYMFGSDLGVANYQNLNDLIFIFDNEDKWTDGSNGDNFTGMLDVLILDAVFAELGDPIVTWIDTTNPNENAEAKAQWYTNLFNSMQTVTTTENDDGTITEEIKTNYQVLENGLATSAEWLRFALESGLVTMQQIDKNNKWCSTLYSNCSDIVEQTDPTEATVAEAEYNAAMAKIEAKDKQFDIQLKNIDTEHESLQTEYDSIKSVLDKNIERNFKMYSA